jgi:hypothetical protein
MNCYQATLPRRPAKAAGADCALLLSTFYPTSVSLAEREEFYWRRYLQVLMNTTLSR